MDYQLPPKSRVISHTHIPVIVKYYNEGYSLPQIAKLMGYNNYACISSFLSYNNIRIRIKKSNYRHHTENKHRDIFDKLKLLDYKNMKCSEIANVLGISKSLLKIIFKKYNIRKVPPRTPVRKILIRNKNYIIEQYEQHQSLTKIANEFDCSYKCISDFFKSIDYKHRGNNHCKFSETDIEMIKKLYYTDNMTLEEVGKWFECSGQKISDFLKSIGLVVRDSVELLRQRNINDDFHRKCFDGCMKYKPYILPNGNILKLRGFEPQFLDHVFNETRLTYTDIIYQPDRIPYMFNNKQLFYYPDFYIHKLNLIVEIKSKYILERQGYDKNYHKELFARKLHNYVLILDNNFTEFDSLIESYIL